MTTERKSNPRDLADDQLIHVARLVREYDALERASRGEIAVEVAIETDEYDEAVTYLTQHPDEIIAAWNYPWYHSAGCLFVPTTRGGGCLTQVKAGNMSAPTPELAAEIRDDGDLPPDVSGITAKNLHVFAAWQRRLDRELGPDRDGGPARDDD